MEITIGIKLDKQTYKKLKEFSVRNNVTQSEIVRALVKKSPIKIKTLDIATTKTEFKACKIFFTAELKDKIIKMSSTNKIAYAEIVRQLVNTYDLAKLPFKTKTEILKAAKAKSKK